MRSHKIVKGYIKDNDIYGSSNGTFLVNKGASGKYNIAFWSLKDGYMKCERVWELEYETKRKALDMARKFATNYWGCPHVGFKGRFNNGWRQLTINGRSI